MLREQIEWLWKNMDVPYRRRHVIALCICAFTCLLLLVNPALSRRLGPRPRLEAILSGTSTAACTTR